MAVNNLRKRHFGSVEDIVQRLSLWASQAPEGLVRVVYISERDRQEVIRRLQSELENDSIPFHEITIRWQDDIPSMVVENLIQNLQQHPRGVVSVTGFEDFRERMPSVHAGLPYLNFSRERIAAPGIRQIWWFTQAMASSVLRKLPDLDSWFVLKLTLDDKNLPVATDTNVGNDTSGPFFEVSGNRPPFIVRQEEYRRLEETIKKAELAVIFGLGGMGKSVLALEYAYKNAAKFRQVFWLLADTEANLNAGFVELAQKLNLPHATDHDFQQIIVALHQWMQTHSEWLFVYDGLDDQFLAEKYIPDMFSGTLLVTSRDISIAHTWGKTILELESLPSLQAQSFLKQHLNRPTYTEQENAAITQLANQLGDYPLALVLAAAYINQLNISFAEYLARYDRTATSLERRSRIHYIDATEVAWRCSIDEILWKNPDTKYVLQLAAFLNPNEIPITLFTEQTNAQVQNGYWQGLSETNLQVALTDMHAFSLLDYAAANETVTLHVLLQNYIRSAMDEPERRQCAEHIVRLLSVVFPQPDFDNWPHQQHLLTQAQVAIRWIEEWDFTFPAAISLLCDVGEYLKVRAAYSEAEQLLKHALHAAERSAFSDDIMVARCLNDLGLIYIHLARFSEAEMLFTRALVIYEQFFGGEHPNVTTILNNLAQLYKVTNRRDEAESLTKRALAIDEKSRGSVHPKVATHLVNLAALYKVTDRLSEAKPLMKRALAIYKKTSVSEHPDLAIELNNLASLYIAINHLSEAESLLKRALNILLNHTNATGHEHPHFRAVRANYLQLLRDKGLSDDIVAERFGELIQQCANE